MLIHGNYINMVNVKQTNNVCFVVTSAHLKHITGTKTLTITGTAVRLCN